MVNDLDFNLYWIERREWEFESTFFLHGDWRLSNIRLDLEPPKHMHRKFYILFQTRILQDQVW